MSVLSELEALGQNEERVRAENRERRDALLARIKNGEETTGRRLLDYALVWCSRFEQALEMADLLELIEEPLKGQTGQLVLVVEETVKYKENNLVRPIPHGGMRRYYLGVLTGEHLPLDFEQIEPRLPTESFVKLEQKDYVACDLGLGLRRDHQPQLVVGALVPEGWWHWPIAKKRLGQLPTGLPPDANYLDPVIVAGNDQVAEYFTQTYDRRELLSELIRSLGLPFEQVPVLVEWREKNRADCRQKIREYGKNYIGSLETIENIDSPLHDNTLLEAAHGIRCSLKDLREQLRRAVGLGLQDEPEIGILLLKFSSLKK